MPRRVMVPVMTLVAVLAGTVVLATRPASGDSVASARATAAAIEAKLNAAQNEMSALSQQYDAANARLQSIDASITTTKATIASDQTQVNHDRSILSKAAIANYVSDGSASSDNPIFSSNEKTVGAATEYNQIAEGDINLAMDNLHTAENTLNAQQAQLQEQQGQAAQAVSTEQAAEQQNAQEIQTQKSALAQENGEIATLVQQQQQAAGPGGSAGRAGQNRRGVHGRAIGLAPGFNTAAPPPTASGGAGRGAGRREPTRSPLRLGRRVPEGLERSWIRLLRTHRVVLGTGRRRDSPTTRAPR